MMRPKIPYSSKASEHYRKRPSIHTVSLDGYYDVYIANTQLVQHTGSTQLVFGMWYRTRQGVCHGVWAALINKSVFALTDFS